MCRRMGYRTTRPGAVRGAIRTAIVALALLAPILASTPSTATTPVPPGQWEPIGPRAATIFSLARDPLDNGRLLAGTHFGGLYLSTDGGLTWSHLETPFSDDGVFDVRFAPSAPQRIYAGTEGHGVYRSTDNGATWQQINQGLTIDAVRSLAIDPLNPLIILAGGFEGLFCSSDGGTTWSPVTNAPDPFPVAAMVFDPVDAGVVYAATQGAGIYKSQDAGQSWSQFSLGIGDRTMTSISFDVNNPDRLLASATEGVFALLRGKSKWLDISEGLPGGGAVGVNTVAGDDRVFASNALGVFVWPDVSGDSSKKPLNAGAEASAKKGRLSTRRGATAEPSRWSRWFRGGGARFVAADTTGSLIHVATTFDMFSVTGDAGKTFFPADRGMQNLFCGALATMSAKGITGIYAGTGNDIRATSELYVSNDALDWESQANTIGAVFELTPDPSNPGTLYAGTENLGILRTTNFGMDWDARSDGLVPPRIATLDQGPAARPTLYAGTNAGVFVSRDQGANWTGRFQSQNPATINTIRADQDFVGWVYYGTAEGRIFRSQDNGQQFFQIWSAPSDDPIQQIDISPFNLIYCVGASGALYASDNPGQNFFQRGQADIQHDVLCVAADQSRPWIAFVGTRFGGVYRTGSSAIDWENRSNGIDTDASVFAIAVDRSDPDTIYAGSSGKIYKSTDEGLSWTPHIITGAGESPVVGLRVDPHDPNILYAQLIDPGSAVVNGASAAGVYRSDDAGATWTRLNNEGTFVPSSGVLPSVDKPGVLFVGSQLKGIFTSDNHGQTWNASNDGMTPIVLGIAVAPDNDQIVYAATVDGGVFRSGDAGETWENIGLRDFAVFHISIDPSNSSRLWASTSLGPMRSDDAGQTWGLTIQENPYVFSVASDPTDRSVVFVGGFGSLMRSDDAGQTWNFAEQDLPHRGVNAIAIDPNDRTVFAGFDEGGIFRSENSGRSWKSVGGDTFNGLRVTTLAIDSVSGDLYAGVWGGILRSTDRGDTWTPMSIGFGQDYPTSIVVLDVAPGIPILYVSVENEQGPKADPGAPIYRSLDGGQAWELISGGILENDAVRVIAPTNGPPGVLFAATESCVYRSIDYGTTWSPRTAIPGATILDLSIDDGSATGLFAATDIGVFRSDDAGATWSPAPIDPDSPATPQAQRLAPGAGAGSAYAGTTLHGLYATTDSGATWDFGVSEDLSVVVPYAIAVSPLDPNRIVAATGFQGVVGSDDGGRTWSFLNNDLDAVRMFTITLDPLNPDTIYATSDGDGVWVSDNAGASWSPLNDGLFHRFVTAFTIDINDHNTLYAGTEGGGVFRMRRR